MLLIVISFPLYTASFGMEISDVFISDMIPSFTAINSKSGTANRNSIIPEATKFQENEIFLYRRQYIRQPTKKIGANSQFTAYAYSEKPQNTAESNK